MKTFDRMIKKHRRLKLLVKVEKINPLLRNVV